jgi:hypothetical protein
MSFPNREFWRKCISSRYNPFSGLMLTIFVNLMSAWLFTMAHEIELLGWMFFLTSVQSAHHFDGFPFQSNLFYVNETVMQDCPQIADRKLIGSCDFSRFNFRNARFPHHSNISPCVDVRSKSSLRIALLWSISFFSCHRGFLSNITTFAHRSYWIAHRTLIHSS